MNYRNPARAVPLSAEYALGTLQGAARRRFQKLMAWHAELREEVMFWELRLSDFNRMQTPIPPPAEAWTEINRLLDEGIAAGRLPAEARSLCLPKPRGTRRWKLAAGLAAAASLVLAFKLGQQDARVPAASSLATWQALPMVVAEVRMPASSMAWLISLSPDRRELTATASEDFLQVGRHSAELWLHSSRGLEPLGLLPVARDGTISIKLPSGLEGQTEITFTISLEPNGGSPTGTPTGPVLTSAEDRGAI